MPPNDNLKSEPLDPEPTPVVKPKTADELLEQSEADADDDKADDKPEPKPAPKPAPPAPMPAATKPAVTSDKK